MRPRPNGRTFRRMDGEREVVVDSVVQHLCTFISSYLSKIYGRVLVYSSADRLMKPCDIVREITLLYRVSHNPYTISCCNLHTMIRQGIYRTLCKFLFTDDD